MSNEHERTVDFTAATDGDGAHEAYFYCTEAEVPALRDFLMARKIRLRGDFHAATIGIDPKTEFYKVDVQDIDQETGDALADEFNARPL